MSYSHFLFFIGVAVVGIVAVVVSRTLNTAEEEKWKKEHWFHEVFFGPPGYYRAVTAILGVILIVVGLIGSFLEIFVP